MDEINFVPDRWPRLQAKSGFPRTRDRMDRIDFVPDPIGFVVSANLKRRHLSVNERAIIGAKLANMSEGRPRKTTSTDGVSQKKAADLMGVSFPTIQRATKIDREGSEELKTAVREGRVSVARGAKIAALLPGIRTSSDAVADSFRESYREVAMI